VKVCSGELILRMGQTSQQIIADLGGLACCLCDRNDRTHFLGTINLEGYSWHTSAPLYINCCGDYEYEFPAKRCIRHRYRRLLCLPMVLKTYMGSRCIAPHIPKLGTR